jgi:hypothetical protein
MPSSARCCAFLLPLLASPAFAQADDAMPRPRPDYRIPVAPSRPVPGGLIATMDAGAGLQFGVGRVRVFEPARLRTHTEPEPMPLDMRRRERSIAAVRLSFSF